MITYLKGDATDPKIPGNKIIVHVCNDIGAWGRGFVLSLSQKYPIAEQSYRRWYQDQENTSGMAGESMHLGAIQYIPVSGNPLGSDRIFVVNMIAQSGIFAKNGIPPIRYDALDECLGRVAQNAIHHKASVHMPRIGCGLAGGKWSEVEQIVKKRLDEFDVYVYDFVSGDERTIPWAP
jgi:O-acetyl-ADP-ribose deacetylase (regulator of RNase III)